MNSDAPQIFPFGYVEWREAYWGYVNRDESTPEQKRSMQIFVFLRETSISRHAPRTDKGVPANARNASLPARRPGL